MINSDSEVLARIKVDNVFELIKPSIDFMKECVEFGRTCLFACFFFFLSVYSC